MFRILAILSFIAFSSLSHAGVYLEPYLGYHKGDYKMEYTALGVPVSQDESQSGLLYGAKIGYSIPMFVFGLDYMTGKITAATDPETNFTTQNFGPFVQVGLPLVKFAATYFVSSTNKDDNYTFKGTGLKIGAGFTGFPIVSINVDYIMLDNNKMEPLPAGVSSVSLKAGGLMVGVSAPFDF